VGNRSKSTSYRYMVCNNSTQVYDPKTDDSVCRVIERGFGLRDVYFLTAVPPGKSLCKACFETMARYTKRSKAKKKKGPRQTGNQATQQAARLSQSQNAELKIVRKARDKI
jgi:hypothetical protein